MKAIPLEMPHGLRQCLYLGHFSIFISLYFNPLFSDWGSFYRIMKLSYLKIPAFLSVICTCLPLFANAQSSSSGQWSTSWLHSQRNYLSLHLEFCRLCSWAADRFMIPHRQLYYEFNKNNHITTYDSDNKSRSCAPKGDYALVFFT